MNQIIKNVSHLLEKYKDKLNTDSKLTLMYWRTYDSCRWDSTYISTKDFLDNDLTPVEDILNAKYILELLKEDMND